MLYSTQSRYTNCFLHTTICSFCLSFAHSHQPSHTDTSFWKQCCHCQQRCTLSCMSKFFGFSRLQTICKTSVRHKKHARFDTCVWVFCIFYTASRDRFLVSRFSNHLTVKSLIIHERKKFSLVMKDKIIVRE